MDVQDINTSITELASLYDNLNERWQNDTCSTDLYQVFRQEEYKNAFEKLKNCNIESIVIGIIANSLNEKILTRLRALLANNVLIYETRKNHFDNIDFKKIFSLQEEHLFGEKRVHLLKEREIITDYPYPTEQERLLLLKENQQEINQLDNERSEYVRANIWMIKDYYSFIYETSRTFISIIESYFPIEKEKEETLVVEKEIAVAVESQPTIVEPDTIFRTKMHEKFLNLEQKLIEDNYLNSELHWISVHDNGKPDIKKLVTFLAGLLDNRYFLPNKDPKVKIFFESRYCINIGQNFERKRREPLISEYRIVFYDYSF